MTGFHHLQSDDFVSVGEFDRPWPHERASLVAQLVKNLPSMQETPVGFLGWEDSLEKG